MASLLLSWCNDEVGLSRTVTNFEADFSSGYLFGEILHKHGQLPGFAATFRDDDKSDTAISNFTELVRPVLLLLLLPLLLLRVSLCLFVSVSLCVPLCACRSVGFTPLAPPVCSCAAGVPTPAPGHQV